MAKLVKRVKLNNGDPSKHYDSFTDNSQYLVEFPDGYTQEIQGNIIAESMLANVDCEGNHYKLLKDTVEHKNDQNAIAKEYSYIK